MKKYWCDWCGSFDSRKEWLEHYCFKDDGEVAFTVTATDRHGVYDGKTIRRLTPLECERLQGFPDGWTLGSDSQRYKQCGNAITVNVVEHVVRSLYETNND